MTDIKNFFTEADKALPIFYLFVISAIVIIGAFLYFKKQITGKDTVFAASTVLTFIGLALPSDQIYSLIIGVISIIIAAAIYAYDHKKEFKWKNFITTISSAIVIVIAILYISMIINKNTDLGNNSIFHSILSENCKQR